MDNQTTAANTRQYKENETMYKCTKCDLNTNATILMQNSDCCVLCYETIDQTVDSDDQEGMLTQDEARAELELTEEQRDELLRESPQNSTPSESEGKLTQSIRELIYEIKSNGLIDQDKSYYVNPNVVRRAEKLIDPLQKDFAASESMQLERMRLLNIVDDLLEENKELNRKLEFFVEKDMAASLQGER